MSNIPPIAPDQNSFSYLVKDSNGDFHQITAHKCAICGGFMTGTPHQACLREVEIRQASRAEEDRKRLCVQKYGQVLSREEEQKRDYPNQVVFPWRESYNNELKRLEREKQEARYKELADRKRRKERLKDAEYEVKWLKAQILKDEEAAKAEQEASKQQ